MKFALRPLSDDNLWTSFIRAKYVKGDHLICSPLNTKGSSFCKAIYKVIHEMYKNCYTRIRDGKASFWFNSWLAYCPLIVNVPALSHPRIKVRDC